MKTRILLIVALSIVFIVRAQPAQAQETNASCACCGAWIKLTNTGAGFDRDHVHLCVDCRTWLKSKGRPSGPEHWTSVINPPVSSEAVRRFLLTREGTWLITALDAMGIKVELKFGSADPAGGHDMSGGFSPGEPGKKKYKIYIKNGAAVPDFVTGPSFYGSANCPDDTKLYYNYKQAESEDAESIYHELLHIWFINQLWNPKPVYPTGHGSWSDCEIERSFLNKLKMSALQLDSLEHCMQLAKKL